MTKKYYQRRFRLDEYENFLVRFRLNKSNEFDCERVNEFHQSIEQFKEFHHSIEQFLRYSTVEIDCPTIGELSFSTWNRNSPPKIIDETLSDQVLIEKSTETNDRIPNKKLIWSIHFKFVPQYIVLYRQSILFASDRWGFVR